ncbi:hypothetical protein K443DRAFT_672944 [Laccaria amethystina LaAM-08-1]|uniref:Unplaced genomic scaffold K443scaffold_9, whole genome shotgun sequence n=1 Tax=Laccaria amethystina LaAM-08-1 TaxID=1095629 RepID=A0A0C9XSZ4_9AGAR|nr:hypothetical protein K443DRAFT_672944 [Laccaria amethystina LaAM-08-1]
MNRAIECGPHGIIDLDWLRPDFRAQFYGPYVTGPITNIINGPRTSLPPPLETTKTWRKNRRYAFRTKRVSRVAQKVEASFVRAQIAANHNPMNNFLAVAR